MEYLYEDGGLYYFMDNETYEQTPLSADQLGDAMKVSLRSIRKVNVSKIAVAYGGGGHIRAAGFEVTGDFDTVVADIIKMIEEQL